MELTFNKVGRVIDDAFRVTTMLVIIALLSGISLTDNEWIAQLLGTLLAFILFDLLMSEHSLIKEHKYGTVIGTLIKLGGMFLLVNYFQSKPYDTTFNITVFGTLLAFMTIELIIINFGDHITIGFNHLKELKKQSNLNVYDDENKNDMFDDMLDCLPEIIKYFIILTTAQMITSGFAGFTQQWFVTTGFALFGLFVYHMIIKLHVTHKVLKTVKETFWDGKDD
jgi:hypothetical protein